MDPELPAERTPEPTGFTVYEARYADEEGGEYAYVGEFRQGSDASRWALARYLVGRAIGEAVGRSLLVVAVLILAAAGLLEVGGHPFWAVLCVLAALGVLLVRATLRALLRPLTAIGATGIAAATEARLRSAVDDTRADVLRELRRLGLPGRTWTLPLLALRLARRRKRADTLERLRGFDVDKVVPASRVDELHLLLQAVSDSDPRY